MTFADLVSEHTPSEVEEALAALDLLTTVALSQILKVVHEDEEAAAIGTPAEIIGEFNSVVEIVAYLQVVHQYVFNMRIEEKVVDE
jgi:hypothetical protein